MTEVRPSTENSGEQQKKPRGRAFKKGQSGNPGGRPKTVGHVRELAQAQTEIAVGTLVEIAKSKKAPPAARVSAATALLDRGYGKPSQPVGGADDLPPIKSATQMTDEQLVAIAASLANG